MKLTHIKYDSNERYYTLVIQNTGLLTHNEVLKPIYYELVNNKEFIEFGLNKVIIITALTNLSGSSSWGGGGGGGRVGTGAGR